MDVQEALRMPSLKGARILAGHNSLDRTITSIMVLEAPDISHWGRKGQMILTSYYALQSLTDHDLHRFFIDANTLEIGALVIKTERLISKIPQEVLDLCDKYHIPLLKISPDTKYEAIMNDIMGSLLDSRMALLDRFYALHRKMMQFILMRPDFDEIIAHLTDLIGFDTLYFKDMYRCRANSSSQRKDYTLQLIHEHENTAYQSYTYYDAEVRSEDGEAEEVLAIEIPLVNNLKRYLVIRAPKGKISDFDTMAIENFSFLLQMKSLESNAQSQRKFIQTNSQIHDLLYNRFPNHDQIDAVLTDLNLQAGPLYQILLIKISPTTPLQERNLDSLLLRITDEIKRLHTNTAFFLNNNRVIALHNYTADQHSFDLNEMREVIECLRNSQDGVGFTYLLTLSRSCDRYSLSVINQEIMNIYKLFDNKRHEDKCVHYNQLGIYKLLAQCDNLNELQTYIDPRLERMRAANPETFNTLVAMTEYNLNANKTAQVLFVHPKTVKYRISRAQSTYGIDIFDSDDFLQVCLAAKIYALLD